MEIHLSPEHEAKLERWARESGRPAAELVRDYVEDWLAVSESESAEARELLDRRYDEIKSGQVKLIPGEEVFARLRAKSEARRARSGQ